MSCARAERRQASSDASEASAAFKHETITRVAGLCIAARPTDVVDDLRVVWARHRVTVRPASRQPHRGLQVTSTAPSPGRASCLSAKLGARLGRLATGKGASGCAKGTSSCRARQAGDLCAAAQGVLGGLAAAVQPVPDTASSGAACEQARHAGRRRGAPRRARSG